MNRSTIRIGLAIVLASLVAGCAALQGDRGEGRDIVLIPGKDLPSGWRLLPQRYMRAVFFLSPEFRKNPALITGADLRYYYGLRTTKPAEQWAAAYMTKDLREGPLLVLIASTFTSPESLCLEYALEMKEVKRASQSMLEKNGKLFVPYHGFDLVGRSRCRGKTIVHMSLNPGSDSSGKLSGDEAAFRRYFRTIADPLDEEGEPLAVGIAPEPWNALDVRGEPAEAVFNSGLALRVWTMNANGVIEEIGKTPSSDPVRIPAGSVWGVAPEGPTTIDAVTAEVRSRSIPGPWLATVVNDSDLDEIARLQGLRTLILRDSHVDDAAAFLRPLKNVEVLDLSGTRGASQLPMNLRELRRLRWLHLRWTRIDDRILPDLTALRELRLLDLGGTEVTDAGLPLLTKLERLRTLDLSYTHVTGAGLAQLTALQHLHELHLKCTLIGDADLQHLVRLKGIQELDLAGTLVTDAGLPRLAEFKNLRALDLAWTNVTDAGMTSLGALNGLQSLSLRGTPVTDAGLVSLQGLKRLRSLDLAVTGVTPAGLDALRKALPDCVMR